MKKIPRETWINEDSLEIGTYVDVVRRERILYTLTYKLDKQKQEGVEVMWIDPILSCIKKELYMDHCMGIDRNIMFENRVGMPFKEALKESKAIWHEWKRIKKVERQQAKKGIIPDKEVREIW